MDKGCSVEGCEGSHRGRGFCHKHYAAWRRGKLAAEAREARAAAPRLCTFCQGPIPPERNRKAIFCSAICKRKERWTREKVQPKRRPRLPCKVEDCGSNEFATGLCQKHYNRLRTKGRLDDSRKNARSTCSVDGCEDLHSARGMCKRHYENEINAHRRAIRLAAQAERKCLHCSASLGNRRADAVFCSRQCQRAEREASGRAAIVARRFYLHRTYGLTEEQVEEMARQGCWICRTKQWTGRNNRPHVDHDHKTGKVRGILCSECNSGLGKFRDNPDLLKAAIAYLAKAATAS